MASSITNDWSICLSASEFARQELGFEPDEMQARALDDDSKEIIINCHRQWGKSTIAGIKGLHRATFHSGQLVLLLSPSLRQSGELFRKVIEFDALSAHRVHKVEETKQFLTLSNRSRIISLPGKEQTVRGYSGVSLLIEDEASQVGDDLYKSVRPMVIRSKGDMMLMSTPRGKRGHFHQIWSTKDSGWSKYMVKAMDNPMLDQVSLEKELANLGEWWYKQEYDCEFVETEEQLFTTELVGRAFTEDVEPLFDDTALTDEVEAFKW